MAAPVAPLFAYAKEGTVARQPRSKTRRSRTNQGPGHRMKIGIVKERREHERRCAASPDTVKKYVGLGGQVAIESGAGLAAAITDDAFKAAGAEIVSDAATALSGADLILKVQRPEGAELDQIKRGAVLAAI